MNNALRQVSSAIIMTAAYGRAYATEDAAIKDWQDGKDFKIVDGPYASVRDSEALMSESSGVYICYGTPFKHVRVL